MACQHQPFRLTLIRLTVFAGSLLLSSAQMPGTAPRAVSLAEAAARQEEDFRPRLLGETVIVRGVVVAPPISAPDAVYVGIIDPAQPAQGLMLVYSGDNRTQQPAPHELRAGSRIEAEGTLSLHAGQAVVKPLSLRTIGLQNPPEPSRMNPLEAASLKALGRLVSLEGVVAEYREASAGDILEFADGPQAIIVFLPLARAAGERPLRRYQAGDRIRVRGIVSQYCQSPPYNRYFQLLLAGSGDVDLLASAPTVSPRLLPPVVIMVLLGILGAWYTQQRNARQNRDIQSILEIGESLSHATSAREVADRLLNSVLDIIPGQSVDLFRFDQERKYFERVPDTRSSSPHAFHLEELSTAAEKALSLAVRNKAILQFANSQSTPLLRGLPGSPQSLLAIPIRFRDEVHGVILICGKPGVRLLSEAMHPAVLHLAHDVGEHLEHLEQMALREQIHRSEKLAVAGQLIHGVLTELRAPLDSIRSLSRSMNLPEAEAIRVQVERASETVSRIISVARAEQMDSRPVALSPLLEKLETQLRAAGSAQELQVEFNLSPDSIHVLGSQLQLQQVFENLLSHACAASAHSLEKRLNVSLNRIGRSAMIEIEFSGPFGEGEGPDFHPSSLGLAISRGLLQSHGGDARFLCLRPGQYRYEVELPSLSAGSAEDGAYGAFSPSSAGQLTALLVEPDMQCQRRFLSIFGNLNHRLIPVGSVEEAADLAEKIRFDLVLSSTRPEGGTWAELFHRVHHRTPHFAVMSESAAFQEEEPSHNLLDGRSASMIAKPVDEETIAKLLARLDNRS